MLRISLTIVAASLVGACTALPASMDSLRWADQRGDRGSQVMKRDAAWCIDAVESRRSLMADCMTEKGWATLP